VTVNDDRFDSGPVQDRRSKAEEIAEKLSSEGCVDEVWLREELYDEPEEMPDVVFKVAEDTGVGVSLFSKAEFGTDTYVHSETGIVGALGPSFREGKVSGQLADVTPTVAEYLGQDMECDGTSLKLFSEGFEPSEPEGDELSGVEV
jgi:predicted AlkP superfamily phosphohydrolase/phosphomutase